MLPGIAHIFLYSFCEREYTDQVKSPLLCFWASNDYQKMIIEIQRRIQNLIKDLR